VYPSDNFAVDLNFFILEEKHNIRLGSVAFWLATTLYQGHSDRAHKIWNIVLTGRYILHRHVLLLKQP
jgi:hypothetical protein